LGRKKDSFDDGLRWYHVLFAWMIIVPFFLIAIVPEGFWTIQVILLFFIIGISGLVLIIKTPLKNKKKNQEG
jgi:uncharacterized membrane protein